MADVKNVITLGLGASPGNIRHYTLFGLDVSPLVAKGFLALSTAVVTVLTLAHNLVSGLATAQDEVADLTLGDS